MHTDLGSPFLRCMPNVSYIFRLPTKLPLGLIKPSQLYVMLGGYLVLLGNPTWLMARAYNLSTCASERNIPTSAIQYAPARILNDSVTRNGHVCSSHSWLDHSLIRRRSL